jgi:hypothetical protein
MASDRPGSSGTGVSLLAREKGESTMSRANDRNNTGTATLFQLGQVVATPGALDLLARAAVNATALLYRHQHGDWGDVSPEDAAKNARAILCDDRILSSFPILSGRRLWIITEADRSVTTLLLPEEY